MPSSDLIPPSPTAADYAQNGPPPDDAALFAAEDPIALFAAWMSEARALEPDANAMALATVDPDGAPDVRMVLLKDFDQAGFTFYSHATSAKGQHLSANPRAALCFHWKSLGRAVRVRGAVSAVDDATADAYFATRDRGAQIGAWASDQSRPLEDRHVLEARIAEEAKRFEGGDVPRPTHWQGWRLSPIGIEFWCNRPFRLHDRLHFARPDQQSPWDKRRLYP